MVEIQAGGPKEQLSQARWSVGSSTKTQIRNAQGCMDNPRSWHVHGPKMDNLAILAMLCKKPKVAKAFGLDTVPRMLECILCFVLRNVSKQSVSSMRSWQQACYL